MNRTEQNRTSSQTWSRVIVHAAHTAKIWHLSASESSEERRKTLNHSILGLLAFPRLSEPSASLAYLYYLTTLRDSQKSLRYPFKTFPLIQTHLTKEVKEQNTWQLSSFISSLSFSDPYIGCSWGKRTSRAPVDLILNFGRLGQVSLLHPPLWCSTVRSWSPLTAATQLTSVIFKAKFKPSGQYGQGPIYLQGMVKLRESPNSLFYFRPGADCHTHTITAPVLLLQWTVDGPKSN